MPVEPPEPDESELTAVIGDLAAEQRRRAAMLAQLVLDGMAQADREVLDLTFRRGLDRAQVAAATATSQQHVGRVLRSASRRFRWRAEAAVLSREGWTSCVVLEGLMPGWPRSSAEPGLSRQLCRRVVRHSRTCEVCGQLAADRGFGPEVLRALPAVPPPPVPPPAASAPARSLSPPPELAPALVAARLRIKATTRRQQVAVAAAVAAALVVALVASSKLLLRPVDTTAAHVATSATPTPQHGRPLTSHAAASSHRVARRRQGRHQEIIPPLTHPSPSISTTVYPTPSGSPSPSPSIHRSYSPTPTPTDHSTSPTSSPTPTSTSPSPAPTSSSASSGA